MEDGQRARIIPVTGIDSDREAEGRATSALLAVLSVVRDFSRAVLTPLGASRAGSATVDSFTEPRLTLDGQTVRPDGMVVVTYGKRRWSALVEVKTGTQQLAADQVNRYWDLARNRGFDCVITISNELAPVPGTHPTSGLRVRSNSPVQVKHLSWTWLLTTAVTVKVHVGVADPEQAWILGELIRYLEHPNSGALAFEDMGPSWVSVRSRARDGHLTKDDEGCLDIAQRWDQLLRYTALTLGADIGEDVTQVLSRKHARDPQARGDYLVARLVDHGRLDGTLRIPNAAGDLEVWADLKAQTLTASLEVDAPTDRGGRSRGTWLAKQLQDAPDHLFVEAYEKGARRPVITRLAQLREDRTAVVTDKKTEPVRFVIQWHAEMGLNRRSGGKNPSFVESFHGLVESFYRQVVQAVTPWTPPPAKLPETPAPVVEPPAAWWETGR